jgi:putative transposase
MSLDTTYKQREYFSRAAGCDRFVWNWALEEWNRQYETGEKPNGNKLKKEFNENKYDAFPWMADIHRDAHADPFARLQKAFVGFFKKIGQRPKFHKKGRKDSFYVANDRWFPSSKTCSECGCVKETLSLSERVF